MIKFSYQEIDVLGIYLPLLVYCIEFLWEFAIFFSVINFRRFHVKLAQRRRAKQQFSKNSKRKLLIPVDIENQLIPNNFYSKGGNLRQVEFRFESEAI